MAGVGFHGTRRLWFCFFFFAFLVLSNARDSVFVPDGEGVVAEGRSLKVRLQDYEDPSANPKHDPKPPGSGRRGGIGGRKNRP
ncbi:Protein PSY1 [Acorus gramineus]|uniref:Protein PSY1 n=1 Tax=Acorus gramineus TaxID=55184 RepID=A0AAV9AKD2_ACOGR|nr:Protein PSY1 [Acorus gramineus]